AAGDARLHVVGEELELPLTLPFGVLQARLDSDLPVLAGLGFLEHDAVPRRDRAGRHGHEAELDAVDLERDADRVEDVVQREPAHRATSRAALVRHLASVRWLRWGGQMTVSARPVGSPIGFRRTLDRLRCGATKRRPTRSPP